MQRVYHRKNLVPGAIAEDVIFGCARKATCDFLDSQA